MWPIVLSKKKVVSIITFLAVSMSLTGAAMGEEVKSVFTVGSNKYTINGVEKVDAAPYIKNGRTYMPLRYAAYGLGIGDNSIYWDDAKKTAYLEKQGALISVKVGDAAIYKNGQKIAIDAKAEFVQGRVMLPVRAISEAFGCSVDWQNSTRQIIITQ